MKDAAATWVVITLLLVVLLRSPAIVHGRRRSTTDHGPAESPASSTQVNGVAGGGTPRGVLDDTAGATRREQRKGGRRGQREGTPQTSASDAGDAAADADDAADGAGGGGGTDLGNVPLNCPVTNKQEELNSFLWRVKRPAAPTSYLFGTIHVPYTNVWDYIPDNSKDAFDAADSVYFELDLTNPRTIAMLASCQMLPQGESLSDILPRDLFRRLKRHLEYVKQEMPQWITRDQRGHGLYADYMFHAITGNWQRKRPVWVMLMVNSLTESDIRSRGIPVLDLYLAQEAARMKKKTGSIERVDEQCLPLNDLNFSQVIFALNKTLSQHEMYREGAPWSSVGTDELIYHYNCGDLNEVIFSHDTARVPNLLNFSLPSQEMGTAKRIDDYFRTELIYKRNRRIGRRIGDLLEGHHNKTFMFACGAGHFLGNNTVLDNLRAQGYDIEHVAPDEELYPGASRRRNRKQSFTHSLPAPPIIISGDLDRIDPFYNRRNRQRHRNNRNRGRKKGRRRGRGPLGGGAVPTDSYKLKQPQFNELWVRLESSSFGPNSFMVPQPHSPLPTPPDIADDPGGGTLTPANQNQYVASSSGRSRALAASSVLSALCAACVLICYVVAWKLVHR